MPIRCECDVIGCDGTSCLAASGLTAMQELWFIDQCSKLAARTTEPQASSIRSYAKWRIAPSYEAGILDDAMGETPIEDWQEIIDAVNGIYADASEISN